MHPFFAAYLWSSLITGMMFASSARNRALSDSDA